MKTKKILLEEIKLIAEQKGGACLSNEYVNNVTKLTFRCSKGHSFQSRPHNIKSGYWCKQCAIKKNADTRRNTIEDMHKIAKERNGKFLSKEYKGMNIHHIWQCGECGYIWEAKPANVKYSTWCPECAKQKINKKNEERKLGIEKMKALAESKDGACLSNEYVNNRTPLQWKCNTCEHIWFAAPSSIISGTWCPKCAGKIKSIEDMQALAKLKGGECLSSVYLGDKIKLRWKCSNGHVWEAAPRSIVRGNWCRECAIHKKQKYNIKFFKELALRRGGRCLSNHYLGINKKHEWECSEGHFFEVTANKIIYAGQWCPQCSRYYTEEKCRYILETIFNEKFEPNRKLLNGYELDGYNKKLNLAFEYNGKQHYEYNEFFHQNNENFKRRKQIDDLKKKICAEKGIMLIEIPYTKRNNLLEYIVNKVGELGFSIDYDFMQFDFDSFYKNLSKIKYINDIVSSKNITCISKEYSGFDTKLEFKCNACNNKWNTSLASIKAGSGCPKCAREKATQKQYKYSIQYLKNIAQKRKGKCLSEKYEGVKRKLKWRCEKGHEWEQYPNEIVKGSWCPECRFESRFQLPKVQEIIRTKKGILLEILKPQKVIIICDKGHTFKAISKSIRNGKWCPECKEIERRNKELSRMKRIASDRNGECLSVEYISSNVPLKWKCNTCDTIWQARPGDIVQGTWCPECKNQKIGDALRGNLNEIKEIARKRGGECVSSKYTTARTKLEFLCKNGHTWKATPDSIKRGSWCLECHRLKFKK